MSRSETAAARPWYDAARGLRPRGARSPGAKGKCGGAGRQEKGREGARGEQHPRGPAGERKKGGFGYRPRQEKGREGARGEQHPRRPAGERKKGGFKYRPRQVEGRREKSRPHNVARASRPPRAQFHAGASLRENAADLGRERRSARERQLTARACALAVLGRAHGAGLFASELLDREFKHGRMRSDDRGLATELVYGCLRRRGALDQAIEQSAGRPMARISRELRDILRIGMYQLLFLDRIPAYAAVDEAVKLALRHGRRGGEKFVNAVLRNAPKSISEVRFPARESDPVKHIAAALSHPEWLVRRWAGRMGIAGAEALCAAGNEQPPLTARVNTIRTTRDRLIAALAAEGCRAAPNPNHPLAVDIGELPRPLPELAAFRNGLFWIQDVSGMRVTDLVGAQRGERIADLCAGPGGKAAGLAAAAGDGAELFCVELDSAKAEMVRENARRLGLRSICCVTGDARTAMRIPGLAPVDRALVDAPCSNTGVLRRRPEARWRLRLEDIPRLAETQGALLAAAAVVVKPGGMIVYSTCSIEPDENEAVIAAFLGGNPDWTLDAELKMVPGARGCDGGYAARLHKR